MSFKKLLLILALAPTLVCFGNYESCEAPCYPAYCNNDCSDFTIYADWLYWRARRCQLDFAIPYDDESAIGDVVDVRPQYDNGFRVGIVGELCDTLWQARYTYYRTRERNTATSLDGDFAGTRKNDEFTEVSQGDIIYTSGQWDLKYDVFDLIAAYELSCSPCLNTHVFGGFTFARIDQEFDITYSEALDVAVGDADFIEETIDVKAYGVNLGLNVEYNFWSCFGAFGNFSYNALLGDVQRRFQLETQAGGVSQGIDVDLNDENWRFINVFNLAFGLQYKYQFCGGCLHDIRVALGYEFHSYTNLDDFLDFQDESDEITFDRHIDNFSLDGLFLRLAIGF